MQAILIFDFDGVLADSLDLFEACLGDACADAGVARPVDRDAFLRLFDANLYDGLRAAGVSDAARQILVAALRRRLEAHAAAYRLWPGIPDVLARLAQSHAVAIVTSGISGVVAGVLQRHGVTCVGEILGAEQGAGKVEKIRAVAGRMAGVPAWYVGDTLGDMIEGRMAGARTVAAAWGWHHAAHLRRAMPDREASSPADLTRLFTADGPRNPATRK